MPDKAPLSSLAFPAYIHRMVHTRSFKLGIVVTSLLSPLCACGGDSEDSNAGAAQTMVPQPVTQPAAQTATQPGAAAEAQPGVSPDQAAGAPVSCGGVTCPDVTSTLALVGVTACCTATNTCGTVNAMLGGPNAACAEMVANASMCPNEMIMGNEVPGCCVMGTNSCGVVNVLTGSGDCIARDSPILALLAQLAPANCDGTMPQPPAMMGTPAAGSMGTAGASGM